LVIATQLIAYILILRNKSEEENQRKGSILSLVAFPNAFLFPLPIVLSLFGSEYIIILVIFSLTAMVFRSTLLTYQCILYGKNKVKSYVDNLKEMLTFPPTITLILSIILNLIGVRLTLEIFQNVNEIISQITSITGALIIGITLVNFDFSRVREFLGDKDFIAVFMIRVIFSFFLFLIVAQFLDFPPEISQIVLIILLLVFIDPPAVTNIAYAEYFELDYEFSGFCVFSITLLAVIYVPIFIFIGMLIF
jgi:predicted permease